MTRETRPAGRGAARTILIAALAVLLSSPRPAAAADPGRVYIWQGSQGGAAEYGDFYVVNNTASVVKVLSGGIHGVDPKETITIDPYGVFGIAQFNLEDASSGTLSLMIQLPDGSWHDIDLKAEKVENDYAAWVLSPSGGQITQTDVLKTDASGACSYGYTSSFTSSQYYTPSLVVGLHAMIGSDDGKSNTNTKVVLQISPNRTGSVYTRCIIF